MKHFKKRTLALVLASVVTVVGAFGAENYKNSLMSLKFESGANGAVNMTLLTKRNYEKTITPVKKDASTYVIMLPETNSQMPSSPEITGNVESVDIKTMPYTTNSKGYTKITVTTLPNTMLNAKKALYVPESKPVEQIAATGTAENSEPLPEQNYQPVQPRQQNRDIYSRSGVDQTAPVDIKKSMKQFETSRPSNKAGSKVNTATAPIKSSAAAPEQPPVQEEPVQTTNTSEMVLILMGVMLVLITSVYFFIKAKNKMTEILGEQPNFSIDDEPDKKKKSQKQEKKQKIRSTIRALDKMYSKPVKMPVNLDSEETQPAQTPVTKPDEPAEERLIVDLDELFNETTNKKESAEDNDENSALEDFLSAFSFTEDEEENNPTQEEESFDEELYNKYINDDNLRFTKDDIERIEQLLNNEISDDTMRNLDKFLVTNPVEKKPSRTEILENFVTSYTVNQNISFTKEDVDVLYKLISVEIDNDFITDLRTNPERLEAMQKEIAKQKSKPHKTSEMLTLNVKDMLPDLSEALKKQGGRRIESEVRPQIVYYSEGYDVSTISLKDQLPDLSIEINNEDAYVPRPSDEIEYAETGYDVAKMSVSDILPDLKDALANPEKYETDDKEVVQADEEALLRNIANVQFKPFYEDDNDAPKTDEPAPTVSDMQEEFSRLDGEFEIIDADETYEQNVPNQDDINDFESLFDTSYVDFDAPPPVSAQDEEQKEEIDINKTPEKILQPVKKENVKAEKQRDKATDKLLQFIAEKKTERKNKNAAPVEDVKPSAEPSKEELHEKEVVPLVCSIGGVKYSILDKADFSENKGCCLIKDGDEYWVAGFISQKYFKIKKYDTLKSEKIQARISERFPDGTLRYIIRIGAHKFILNVKENGMEYVMDLC